MFKEAWSTSPHFVSVVIVSSSLISFLVNKKTHTSDLAPSLSLSLSTSGHNVMHVFRRAGRNTRHTGSTDPNRIVRIPLRDPPRHGRVPPERRRRREHKLRDRTDAPAGARRAGAGRQSAFPLHGQRHREGRVQAHAAREADPPLPVRALELPVRREQRAVRAVPHGDAPRLPTRDVRIRICGEGWWVISPLSLSLAHSAFLLFYVFVLFSHDFLIIVVVLTYYQ